MVWLMAYPDAKTASFVGVQRIVGSIAGKKSSFVVQTIGVFDGTTATGTWSVIAGCATDTLAGITSEGTFGAPHGSTAEYQLDYDLGRIPARLRPRGGAGEG